MLQANLGLLRGININSLEETFDFQAISRKVVLNIVDNIKGIVVRVDDWGLNGCGPELNITSG